MMTGHSCMAMAKFFKAFRSSIAADCKLSEFLIWLIGVQVQLDECKLGKRKFNQGRRVEGV